VLLQKIKDLDEKADQQGLNESGWRDRYKLEGELEEIFTYEDIVGQQRCSVEWILKGDSNSGFFTDWLMGERENVLYFS
jgi:hypothetical protein